MAASDDLRTRRWAAVAAVVLLFLGTDFAVSLWYSENPWPDVVMWSVIAGQFHLIVIWGRWCR